MKSSSLNTLLEPIRQKYDLPALAGAIVTSERIVVKDAVGVRKYGGDVPVTADDPFHIGSCTKAMTATLIAMLIEQGKLKWDTSLTQALPDLAGTMQPAYRSVTLDQLMAQRSGFSGETQPQGKTLLDLHRLPGTPAQQRLAYARMILSEPPAAAPGSKFIYSNRNYALLGVIAERTADKPWEQLITDRLFKPLGMTTAGFGAMGTPGKIDAPWQHTVDASGHHPVPPGPLSDNPQVIGPAGTVHCSIGDWAKFIQLHLRGEQGRDGLLKAATIRRLHAPQFGGDYAAGWLVTDRDWGGGRVLTHAGSNTLNFAVVWMAPKRDFAVLAATNEGGDTAAKACDEAAAALIGYFLKSH